MEDKNFIPIINKKEISKVFIENILLIEQELRKIFIFAEEDQHYKYGKIDELLIYLDDRFFRCHQSCFINMEKIVMMRDQTFFFNNGYKYMVGREKFHLAKQKFAGYMTQEAQRIQSYKKIACMKESNAVY